MDQTCGRFSGNHVARLLGKSVFHLDCFVLLQVSFFFRCADSARSCFVAADPGRGGAPPFDGLLRPRCHWDFFGVFCVCVCLCACARVCVYLLVKVPMTLFRQLYGSTQRHRLPVKCTRITLTHSSDRMVTVTAGERTGPSSSVQRPLRVTVVAYHVGLRAHKCVLMSA